MGGNAPAPPTTAPRPTLSSLHTPHAPPKFVTYALGNAAWVRDNLMPGTRLYDLVTPPPGRRTAWPIEDVWAVRGARAGLPYCRVRARRGPAPLSHAPRRPGPAAPPAPASSTPRPRPRNPHLPLPPWPGGLPRAEARQGGLALVSARAPRAARAPSCPHSAQTPPSHTAGWADPPQDTLTLHTRLHLNPPTPTPGGSAASTPRWTTCTIWSSPGAACEWLLGSICMGRTGARAKEGPRAAMRGLDGVRAERAARLVAAPVKRSSAGSLPPPPRDPTATLGRERAASRRPRLAAAGAASASNSHRFGCGPP